MATGTQSRNREAVMMESRTFFRIFERFLLYMMLLMIFNFVNPYGTENDMLWLFIGVGLFYLVFGGLADLGRKE